MATLCLLCGKSYKDPRVLPCLHSFCLQCIAGLYDAEIDSTFPLFCPVCNYKLNISKDEVKKLPENFGFTNLQPILRIHKQDGARFKARKVDCENCKAKRGAVSRCNDCCVFMCTSCTDAHARIQALQSHSVITFDNIKQAHPRDLAKQHFCKSHEDEPLKLYCETCEAPICRECTVCEHKDHKYNKIGQVIHKEKSDVVFSINAANYQLPGLEKTLNDVKNMQIRVKRKAITANKDVDMFIDTQIRILQQIRSELKLGISTVTKAKLHALNNQQERLAMHLHNLKTGVQFAEQCVSNGSDCEVLTIKKQTVTRLQALSSKFFDSFPCQDDGLNLNVDRTKTVRDLVPKLAWLDSTTANPSLCSLQVIGGEPNMIYTTFCDQGCEFVIILRDHFGQHLRHGDRQVRAAITDCPMKQQHDWESNMKYLEVIDNDDGTYNTTYIPQYPGRYKISVAVERCHIKGSPFCWYVSQRLERISMHKLDICEGDTHSLVQGSSTTLDDIVIDGWYCFSWRVKFRTRNLLSSSISLASTSTPTHHAGISASHSTSFRSLQSYFFQGCKIGVCKVGKEEDASFEASCEETHSRRGSLSQETWRELNKESWFWCEGFCYSPSEPSGLPSNITSFEDGDVFVLFLNPVKKTLIIYNRESEQKDIFLDVEFPVKPLLKG